MITLSIDVTKVDKARLVKGKYLDLVLHDTPNGKYGDFMVKQQVTKEERQSRVEMPILGNGKDWSKGQKPKQQPAEEFPKIGKDPRIDDDSDSIPF